MFVWIGAALAGLVYELLGEIARVLNEVDSRITLTGHTDAAPFSGGERGYSNWELSADRANASRRELIAAGIDERKVLRVVGLAAVMPLDAAEPNAPINRRISILVMNKSAEQRLLNGTDLQAGSVDAVESALVRSGQLSLPAASGEAASQASPKATSGK